MTNRAHDNNSGGRFSFVHVLRLAAGGGIGGLITFIIMSRSLASEPLFGNVGGMRGDWFHSGLPLGAAIGCIIGACLIAAEEWRTRSVSRILWRSFFGGLAGLICGALGGLDGQFVFITFQWIGVTVVRCIGWGLLGAGAGLCPGFVAKSWMRANLGGLGGLIGGAVAGFLFDPLVLIFHNGFLGMALSLILIGAAIGIAVGFIEEIAKNYWLTFLSGSKEGQSYSIMKNEATLGRDETLDIPLFGDNSVQKLHARIFKTGNGISIRAEQVGSPVLVNSQPVVSANLSDGDVIEIGRHKMRVGTRHSSLVIGFSPPVPQPPPASIPQQSASANRDMLQVIGGPHMGETFHLTSHSMSMGRGEECDIALPRDSRISRRHARIFWNGTSWTVEDSGSTNGLFVNNQRVTLQVITPGDIITMGDSSLRV